MVKFKVEDANFNKIYPIGSIYMSINETNPSELFGGEWEQIKDRFLLAGGDTYDSGSTGGSADSVVVKHNHTQKPHTHTTTRHYVGIDSDTNWSYTNARSMSHTSGSYYYPFSDKNTNGITELNTMTSVTATNNEIGVSGTGKNMPPYLAVFVWVRIA